MPRRNLDVTATVSGKHRVIQADYFIRGLGYFWRKVKKSSLQAFAIEVRRRARIRLAVNRFNPPGFWNTRYPVTLANDIHFDVGEKSINFEVGRLVPYAAVEDMPKNQEVAMRSNGPYMSFFWYRVNAPKRFNRPAEVKRTGKAFFTDSFIGSLNDFEKIIRRNSEAEERKLNK